MKQILISIFALLPIGTGVVQLCKGIKNTSWSTPETLAHSGGYITLGVVLTLIGLGIWAFQIYQSNKKK